MKRSVIRGIFIALLFLTILAVFVYTAYFIPDHRMPGSLMDYGIMHTVIYTPVLFAVGGLIVWIICFTKGKLR